MFACKNIFTPNFNGNAFFGRKTEQLYVAEQKFYFCSFQCYNTSESSLLARTCELRISTEMRFSEEKRSDYMSQNKNFIFVHFNVII